eukprot:TRINITY_DN14644_c0_g1_i1.p2 TRINITY_DN14644_c0_g1~~TRINITY_DN14644_c0_g1_i1.p2  ORF type:complete len:143 (-),score=33.29 TRINITY_DN14644_c0_g1_i1:388-816(-)
MEGGMQSIEEKLVETKEQNKAWVNKKNKVNDKISESEIISVHTNTGIEGEYFERIKNEGTKLTKKEHIEEFSPIVYWRDPLPDITGLEMQNIRKQEIQYFQHDPPVIIKTKAKGRNKSFENVSLDKGKEIEGKYEKPKIKEY